MLHISQHQDHHTWENNLPRLLDKRVSRLPNGRNAHRTLQQSAHLCGCKCRVNNRKCRTIHNILSLLCRDHLYRDKLSTIFGWSRNSLCGVHQITPSCDSTGFLYIMHACYLVYSVSISACSSVYTSPYARTEKIN